MNKDLRSQFSILKNRPEYTYLDSAASSLTPDSVLDKMNAYYTEYRSNIHRGVYADSEKASAMYEQVREQSAAFFGAKKQEIFFTSGTTDGINKLAYGLEHLVGKGDVILLTELEHHANLIPWQELVKRSGAELRFISVHKETFELDENLEQYFDEKVKIVSITHVSNTLGTILPIEKITTLAHHVGALVIVDAAQSVAHMQIEVTKIDCDFLVCSGHKMYGPTGVGMVYGKTVAFEKLNPAAFGGDMIDTVTYEKTIWAEIPRRFEAGTPNIAGVIGLGAALECIMSLGWNTIIEHEKKVTEKLIEVVSKHGILIGTNNVNNRIGVVSFAIEGIHPHDVAGFLNERHIAVRAGHHCTMPLVSKLNLPQGTARCSIGIYTTEEDIDRLDHALGELVEAFKQ
ncbi:MAG TPA: cysteine desulfurase [Candidatus Magasanikbacteria bacterium]|nr:cysteine desulfurase [Candidatus Magasanikbacteria bacterium]